MNVHYACLYRVPENNRCRTNLKAIKIKPTPTGLILGGIRFHDLPVEPHVGDRHAVLGQGSGFVGANGRSRPQGLDSFQVLDQTVLASHALGRQG